MPDWVLRSAIASELPASIRLSSLCSIAAILGEKFFLWPAIAWWPNKT
jgi:hypothetical protein